MRVRVQELPGPVANTMRVVAVAYFYQVNGRSSCKDGVGTGKKVEQSNC